MNTTGGKGGYDAELIIGATIDASGLQTSLDRAFKSLQTPEIGGGGKGGKKMLENLLPQSAMKAFNDQITALQNKITDFNTHLEHADVKRSKKTDKNFQAFLQPYKHLVAGLDTERAQFERISRLINQDMNALVKVTDALNTIGRNQPKNTKLLDLFSALPDDQKLARSASTIRRVQEQVAQQKKLLDDLKKLHEAARASGNTDIAKIIGGQVGLQARAVSQYGKGVDLDAARSRIAAQQRKDEADAKRKSDEARRKADAEQKRVDAENKRKAEAEQKRIEQENQARLNAEAKHQAQLRKMAEGRDALARVKGAVGPVDYSRLTKAGTTGQLSDLKSAIAYLREMEVHYNKIAMEQHSQGQSNKVALAAMESMAKAAKQYEAEQERIKQAITANAEALRKQKVEAEKLLTEKQKLASLDRAAQFQQVKRDRGINAAYEQVRRKNPYDDPAMRSVMGGTSTLSLKEQNEVINKSIAAYKAMIDLKDKLILADQKENRNVDALKASRDVYANSLKNLRDASLQLTAALEKQAAAERKADALLKQRNDFQKRAIITRQGLESRYAPEKAAATARQLQGGPLLTGQTAEQLKQQNAELQKALDWHSKIAGQALQELNTAKNLGLAYSSLQKELDREVAAMAAIRKEKDQVIRATNEQVRVEREALKIQQQQADASAKIARDLAARVKGLTGANQQGNALVKGNGGYANFNGQGLNLKETRLASEALSQMASAMRTAYEAQLRLGQGTQKMRDNLDKVANSARGAKDQLAAMEREAAKAHGVKRLGEEIGSTIKNFAKFAIIYQGLYSLIGFFRGLTDAVVALNKELANMQAVTASSTEQMKGISTAILGVASSSRFSISEVTEAAKVIAQAGASAEELPKILQSVTDFAAGTDTALATAADIVTSVREVYKNLSDAQVANQLTKAVNISKLSGEDLKTIMSIGAQVAEGYNVTSEQMLAAASTLRNAGVKASTISTGLRQALLEVFNPQDNTVKALQKQYAKLGQNLSDEVIKARFYNFSKESDPLMSVLRELKTLGFGGEGDFSLGRAFDVRALNVLKELVKSTDEYLALQREITFGQPAAEAAATSMESLSASWQKFKNLLTGGIADESGPFLKGLQKILDKMSEFLEKKKELSDLAKSAGTGNEVVGESAIRDANALSNPAVIGGLGVGVVAGLVSLMFPVIWPLVIAAMAVSGAALLYENVKTLETTKQSRLEGARGVAATSQDRLDKAQAAYDAYRTDTKDSGVGKELHDAMTLATNVRNAITETMGADALNSEEVNQVLKELQGTNTIERRKELIAKLQTLAQDSNKVTFDSVGSLITLMEEAAGSTRAMVANFASLHKQLTEISSRSGPEGEKATAELAKLAALTGPDGSSPMLKLLMGNGTPEQIQEQYRLLMEELAKSKAEGIQKLTDQQIANDGDVFSKALAAVEDLPQEQRTARVQQLVTGYLAKIAQMGEESGQKALMQLGQRFAAAFGVGGLFEDVGGIDQGYLAKTYGFTLGEKGQAPLPGLGGAPLPAELAKFSQELRDKKAKKEAELAQETAANLRKVDPALTKQVYAANPAVTARANALDFEVQKLQKFGDAAGKAADLIREKNSLLVSEKNEELKTLLHNREVAKQYGTENIDFKKAEADVAEKQLEIQKLQLQGQEEYLDNMQKSSLKQMGMYDQQKATILAAGGSFDGLLELNDEYVNTQKGLISSLESYMRDVLHMTEEEITNYIESRPELKKGLLSDKDYNAVDKKNNALIKAAEAAIPKSATTGNALMDARARAGLGFTNAEEVKFAADKAAATQNVIDLYTRLNASDSVLAKTADAATAEAIQAKIDTRIEGIQNLNNELQDLAAQIEDFSATAGDELASVFDDRGIRFFTHALETSGNALKDWGDNIRNSLVTAWDSVGDAISSALLDGENFVDSMKKIARDLAREVFTMTTKNVMNNLLLGGLTGSYGGATTGGAQGQTAATTTPAQGGGGFLSSIASAMGLAGPTASAAGVGGSAVGTMTVNASVVNVNGAAGGAVSAAKDAVLGEVAPEKSLFQTVEEKVKSGMDSVMTKLGSAFDSLKGGIGGLLNGIGDIASDLFNGATGDNGWLTKGVAAVGQWFGMTASTGAIIPMKFAGGYVSRSGVIKGPGSGTSDSIRGSMYTKSGRAPIMVSSGESILTAKATSMLGENTIKSLNAGTARKFSTGGAVAQSRSNADAARLKTQAPSVTVNPAAPQSIQMINAIDSDSVVQAGLGSPASVKVLLNVVKANKSSFNSVLN